MLALSSTGKGIITFCAVCHAQLLKTDEERSLIHVVYSINQTRHCITNNHVQTNLDNGCVGRHYIVIKMMSVII